MSDKHGSQSSIMQGTKYLQEDDEDEEEKVRFSCYKKDVTLIDQPWFNGIVGSAVFLSIINMGLEVDLDLGMYAVVMGHVFATVWTVEAACKIYILGPRTYFGSKMNCLDFALTWMAIVETWLLPLLGGGGGAGLKNLAILRLIRLIRLVRMVKLLRSFEELWLLIHGLMRALAVLVWVLILLLIIIFLGAIFLTNTIGGECLKPEYADFEDCFMLYGTLLRSMLTLFTVVLDGQVDAVRPVFEYKPYMILFYVGFVYLTTFGLMNIVAGVIFDQIQEENDKNDQKLAQEKIDEQKRELRAVQKILMNADHDDPDHISLSEWLKICEDEDVKQIFKNLGLEVGRKRLAQRLYEVVDVDRTQKVVLDYMLERIFQLKTEGRAQNTDMTLLLMEVRHQGQEVKLLGNRVHRIEDKLDLILQGMSIQMPQHLKPQLQGAGMSPSLSTTQPSNGETPSSLGTSPCWSPRQAQLSKELLTSKLPGAAIRYKPQSPRGKTPKSNTSETMTNGHSAMSGVSQ